MMGTSLLRHVSRLMHDRGGNFAIMTAVAIPVLAGSAGIAIDVSNMIVAKSQLQEATDAAALATATSLAGGAVNLAGAPQLAKDFVAGQMANYLADNPTASADIKSNTALTITPTTDPTTGANLYNVNVTSSYSMPVNGLTHTLGWNSFSVATSSTSNSAGPGTSGSSKNALSMYLALDKSGSMSWVTTTVDTTQKSCVNYTEQNWPTGKKGSPCYVTKIAALKAAAGALFDQLDASDPKDTLVRVGGVAYTDSTEPLSPQTLQWSSDAARKYVNSLPTVPQGGTDASGPMKLAYQSLTAQSETDAQTAKGNSKFSKYIILMTDGENTGHSNTWDPSLDKATLQYCQQARTAGITIYTVAFQAPANGKAMLQSCSGDVANYYEANDMPSLVAAFKSIGQKASEQFTRLTQ